MAVKPLRCCTADDIGDVDVICGDAVPEEMTMLSLSTCIYDCGMQARRQTGLLTAH